MRSVEWYDYAVTNGTRSPHSRTLIEALALVIIAGFLTFIVTELGAIREKLANIDAVVLVLEEDQERLSESQKDLAGAKKDVSGRC